MRQRVLGADQSPMNARRWSVFLGCGCLIWVTSRGRPRAATCPSHPKGDFAGRATPEKDSGGGGA